MSITAHLQCGVEAHRRGDFHGAIDHYWQLLRAQPRCAEAYHNLAEALASLGHLEDARQAYRAALAVEPTLVVALRGLAALCFQQGEYTAAENYLRRAVQLEPAAVPARVSLGLALAAQGALAAAADELQSALEIDADSGLAHAALAQVRAQLGRPHEALWHWRRATAAAPRNVSYAFNLANALRDDGQLAEACTVYRTVLQRQSDHAGAMQNLTITLGQLGDVRGSLDAAVRWRQSQPLRPESLRSLAVALQEAGHDAEARRAAAQALEIDATSAESRLLSAQLELAAGNLPQGWRYYAARKQLAPTRFPWSPAIEQLPAWDGSPIRNQHVLLLAEQGLGEELMHSTCYRDLLAAAGRVTIACHPTLAGLMSRSFATARVVPCDATETLDHALIAEPVDLRVMAGDLPGFLRMHENHFQPEPGGHLAPDPIRVAAWRKRLDRLGEFPKIGLAWRGGTVAVDIRRRSVPLAQFAPLLRDRQATFVALQPGQVHQELSEALGPLAEGLLVPENALASGDMDDAAALIAALDLVVSVANTTLHLAGAVGTPALGLLRHAADWWWFPPRSDSPWYASVELARQSEPGDWRPCLAAAAQRVAQCSRRGRSAPATLAPGYRLDTPQTAFVIHVDSLSPAPATGHAAMF